MANNHIKPHDHLFRSIMARKKVAKEFFLKHLPASLKKIVDFKTLKLQRDSYIGDNLHEQIADLLYSVDFNGISGYIYVLVEHQSKPEKLMPFRILKYMIAIMEDHLHKTGKDVLPIVYPIIMYSGSKTYNYSTNLFDLFGRQKKLALKILWQPCQLVDLATIPDQELDRFLWYGTFARVMKYIHKYRKNIVPLLKQVILKLQKIENLGDSSYIMTTMRYFFITGETPDKNEFREVIQQNLTKTRGKIMSFAEHLRLEGRAEGYEKGMLAGVCRGKKEGKIEGKIEGKMEGKIEGKIETAKAVALKLLQRNFDLEIIADSTGLSLPQILELKKEINIG